MACEGLWDVLTCGWVRNRKFQHQLEIEKERVRLQREATQSSVKANKLQASKEFQTQQAKKALQTGDETKFKLLAGKIEKLDMELNSEGQTTGTLQSLQMTVTRMQRAAQTADSIENVHRLVRTTDRTFNMSKVATNAIAMKLQFSSFDTKMEIVEESIEPPKPKKATSTSNFTDKLRQELSTQLEMDMVRDLPSVPSTQALLAAQPSDSAQISER